MTIFGRIPEPERWVERTVPPQSTLPPAEWSSEQFPLPFCIDTREQLGAAAAEIAEKQLRILVIEGQRARKFADLEERFKYGERLDALRKEIEERLGAAFSFCLKHQGTEFAAASTIDFPTASVKFTVCPPAVRELEGWKLADILGALKRWRKWGSYVRIKFELNKKAILEDRAKFKDWQWRKRGLAIDQARSLTITPAAAPEQKVNLVK